MQYHPLRALLRGCKLPSRTPTSSSSTTTTTTAPVSTTTAAPDLDFFNTTIATAQNVSPSLSPQFLALIPNKTLQTALVKMNITDPTPIQLRALPHMHSSDVLAIAPTGSGKTLCYLLPLVQHHLETQNLTKPHSLILAPTRELAHQISRVLTRLLKLCRTRAHVRTLTTPASVAAWKAAPTAVHFIVATPRRLLSAADSIRFTAPKYIILDEADELLHHKFLAQLDQVLHVCGARTSQKPRIHLFSATIPSSVAELAKSILQKPKRISVATASYGGAFAVDDAITHIEQKFMFVGGRSEQGKVMAVRNLIRNGAVKPPVLVFVQSKERAADLFRELVYDGIHVDAIHGDRTPAARASAVARFRSGKIWVLICTDVLARGLDFLAVQTVISYDMPSSGVGYVHRIGRTGRNGKRGSAITLFTEEDRTLVGAVVKVAKASGAAIPEWLLRLGDGVRRANVKRMERSPPMRRRIGGPNRERLHARKRGRLGVARGKEARTEVREEAGGTDGDGGEEDDVESGGVVLEKAHPPKERARKRRRAQPSIRIVRTGVGRNAE